MPEANPEAGAITDEASAAAHISKLLSEPERPTEEAGEEDPEANREEPEEVQETKDESESEADEAEPEGESDELPDTIEGLAEALGMDAGDLSGHLKVPVKINGKVEHVNIAEAVKGYQQESDYRQKTMEISDQRRQFEATATEVSQRWQQRFTQLDGALQAAADLLESGPSEADLERLMDDDPREYFRVKTQHEKNMQKLQQAYGERQRLQQEYEADQQAKAQRYRAEQQELLADAMPEVRDPVKLSAFERDTAKYLGDSGFSNDQIGEFFGGAFDHRQVLIVRDAMKYRAMEKGKKTLPKKLQGLGRVTKPGVLPSRGKTAEDKIVASRDRLKRLAKKRGTGAKQKQTRAAEEFVKNLL